MAGSTLGGWPGGMRRVSCDNTGNEGRHFGGDASHTLRELDPAAAISVAHQILPLKAIYELRDSCVQNIHGLFQPSDVVWMERFS
jgi:hypothetical protein